MHAFALMKPPFLVLSCEDLVHINIINTPSILTKITRLEPVNNFRFNTQFDSTPSQHTLPGVELKVSIPFRKTSQGPEL